MLPTQITLHNAHTISSPTEEDAFAAPFICWSLFSQVLPAPQISDCPSLHGVLPFLAL